MKEKIKNSNSIHPSDLARVAMVFNGTGKFIEDFRIFIKQYYDIVSSVENTEIANPKVARTKNGRMKLLSNCAVCDCKNRNLSNSKKL